MPSSSSSERTVLITGCSDGGLGAAIAIALHEAGLHVIATARNPSKMKTLDTPSRLLISYAGGGYNMPVSDLSITEAKKQFDLNVWSHLAVTQAFLPLLLKSSSGTIVNHTSGSSVVTIPFQFTYSASKTAVASFSESQRMKLAVFGIRVIDMKSGMVQSQFSQAMQDNNQTSLPDTSIYAPAKEIVEKTLRGELIKKPGATQKSGQWAKNVVQDLLKTNPPHIIWREEAMTARLAALLPVRMIDGTTKKMTGLDIVEQVIGAGPKHE
ncbi:NAD(P)-binding protein [Delitschia confertaspora ATCC 74209]|uniref:NAD(P)-binding protein n=1 Tax=Delitschia confertaspora ATCC 74209 TaxID=1513339 RepID=A0A9P4JJ00_9PLEO|nr:NAD(P)-binding protein [Delitschia confertaspora ATCC 74209]